MVISITQVPLWVSIIFIFCFSTIPVYLIANAITSAYQNGNIENGAIIRKRIFLFYWTYFLVVAIISLTGFFEKNILPPRIIIFTVIPLFLFYIFDVQKREWFKIAFKHITLEQLIYIHVFRFVGVFFFLVYLYDAIPKEFALVGGTGDIISAVLVFPVVAALKKGKSYARSIAWIWNIIGLVDIISVLSTAIILTKFAMANNEAGVQQFGTFPFSWIPAFAPPTIVFLHILIFKKLREKDTVLAIK